MDKSNGQAVEIVEVGPRDGFQGIGPFIPTETKIGFLERLVAAGVRRIEIGSFVSAKAVPQLRDTRGSAGRLRAALRASSAQVLVPSERRGREAVAAGAKHRVRAVGDGGAQPQQRPAPSARIGGGIRAPARRHPGRRHDAAQPRDGLRLPVHRAGAGGGGAGSPRPPGAAAPGRRDRPVRHDGTGRPRPCGEPGRGVPGAFPEAAAWALHAHDTYGLGLANVHAAYRRACACSTPRSAAWAAARSRPGPPATSRPRTWSGCSSAWGSRPGSTSRRWSPWRRGRGPARRAAGRPRARRAVLALRSPRWGVASRRDVVNTAQPSPPRPPSFVPHPVAGGAPLAAGGFPPPACFHPTRPINPSKNPFFIAPEGGGVSPPPLPPPLCRPAQRQGGGCGCSGRPPSAFGTSCAALNASSPAGMPQ